MDGAVAALGEEIRQHPDASPVLLNDPAYVGVAVTSLPGRPGFHRVRTPQVDHGQVADVVRATAGLRADPVVLLARALFSQFRPLLVVAGLPPITFHALRHTAATLLLGQGEHPRWCRSCWGTRR